MSHIFFIDQTHQAEILSRFRSGLIVIAGAVEADEFTLLANTQGRITGVNQLSFGFSRKRQLFFSGSRSRF